MIVREITDVKIAKSKDGIYQVVIYTDEDKIVIRKPMRVTKKKSNRD